MKARSVVIAVAACASCGVEPHLDDVIDEPPPPVVEATPPWGVPITGGTLLVTRDGNRAAIADPDRDRIVIVDLRGFVVSETIALPPGSEPGRLVEDGAGRIHVALRGAGELWTWSAGEVQRRAICAEPRGLAWQAKEDLVHVACATGELVSVPASGGQPVRVVRLDRDLRDVIVQQHGLVVTTFRSATLLHIDAKGNLTSRDQPPITQRLDLPGGGGGDLLLHEEPAKVDAVPAVAWRTIALPDGQLVMAHQRKVGAPLKIIPGGYGADCGHGPVESAITTVSPRGQLFATAPFVTGALPVDVASDPDGTTLAFAVAGAHTVVLVPASALVTPDDDQCGSTDQSSIVTFEDSGLGAPTSVAFGPQGELLAFYPDLSALVVRTAGTSRTLYLGGDVGHDAGRELFHQQANVQIACASCHPEGRDDGQVWVFEELGPRRTQNLAGGILGRAPYHWTGDMQTISALVQDVFTLRMAGGEVPLGADQALGRWLDRIAPPSGVVADAEAVARGRALFEGKDQGCSGCHGGPLLTNNALVGVGTGGAFKVPSLLGIGGRAPYMHDGCATTLRDRFGICGGGDLHGHTSQLTSGQIDDLIAYLESL